MRFRFGLLLAIFIAGCAQAPENQSSSAKAELPPCCELDRAKVVALLAEETAPTGDWPMFGGTPDRNMANTVDKNIPSDWSVEEGKSKNIKWTAQLGSVSYGGPVIADGKVFIGTNNSRPRDPKTKGSRAVLMAFAESDGTFLWQIAHEYPADEIFKDAITVGLVSTPVVEGKRVYYVTPACEMICADTDGKIQWRFDMMKELKVIPFHCGNCSPLIAGDLVVALTSNGIGDEGKVASPEAPSFVAFNKNNGKVIWQSNLPGANIIEGQWSNPALAKVNGKEQVIFPGGDSFLYGLDLATGKMIWKFDCQPKRLPAGEEDRDLCYIVSTPVIHDAKVYVGLGVAPDGVRSPPFSHFLCVDATKTGDVSPKTLDAKDAQNKDSALVWSYGGKIEPTPKLGKRRIYFGKTISTCAIQDGLVYISEEAGIVYCLDAKTGQKYWEHDFKAGIWGSPYYVDGKVYIGTDDGEIAIFAHGKEKKLLNKIDMGEVVQSTPTVARGVLYVMTKSKLYAIAEKK